MRDRHSLAALAAGTLSLAILSGLLVAHAWPLWTGEPIYLAVRPVDPRDLFRGDYVTLGYDVQQLALRVPAGIGPPPSPPGRQPAATSIAVEPLGDWWQPYARGAAGAFGRRDRRLYLQLRAEPSDVSGVPMRYVPVSLADRPVDDAVNLAGWLRYYSARHLVTLDFGIDALFVQEGAGRPIEDAILTRVPVFAEVFVTRTGKARVRALIIEGRRVP